MRRRTEVIAIVLLIAAGGLAGLVALMPDSEPRVVVTGTADVGGPFTLTAHTGERVSDEAFRGKYMLVAFGFTHCPDVCPAQLQVMTAAVEDMGAEALRIQPLFITIDPERDTAAHLSEYMANFPPVIGLTGTKEEIAAVAKAYHVWYEKVEEAGSPDYLMDHTSITYLMDPKGEFVQHFSFGIGADALKDALLATVE